MKSKIKSILLIILMLVSISGIALTVNNARISQQNNSIIFSNQQIPSEKQGGKEAFGENTEENQPPSVPDDRFSSNEEKMPEMPNDNRNGFKAESSRLSTVQIAIIGVCSLVFSIFFVYLLMSIKNKDVFAFNT